ncbi:hypothetical protein FHS57_006282 [Runella defluvii]|uniref:Uncharacterized protein n=1 Tax=Runella defluvii TaxID=370973 RepID=A0A7W6EUC3_9BACT|nr:hypothetical protein [Runella defluvii]
MNNIYIIKHLPINKGHPFGNDELGIFVIAAATRSN